MTKPTAGKLDRYASDPAAFVDDLPVGPGRFGDHAAPYQREWVQAAVPALLAVASGTVPPVGRLFYEGTKGTGKDWTLAAFIVWLLLFARRPILIQVGAADQDQAAEVRRVILDFAWQREWIGTALEVQSTRIVNARAGGECDIIAADVWGSHGARPDVVVLNELTHLQKEDFASNLFDNLGKVPTGLGIVAGNAGALDSWQWRWRESARTSPRWSFHVWDKLAPWLDEDATIGEAERRGDPPARVNRLWRGVWSSGEGDALDCGWIDGALTLPGPILRAEPFWAYCAGLDLGLKRDRSGLVIVGKHVGGKKVLGEGKPARPMTRLESVLADIAPVIDRRDVPNGWPSIAPRRRAADREWREVPRTNRLRVARVKLWAPPAGGEVDVADVEEAVIDAAKRYRLRGVWADKWQAAHLLQRLRRRGVRAVGVDFTGHYLRTMAAEMMVAFREHKIELYSEGDGAELVRDLRNLRLVEKSYGVRLESPRGPSGHGDAATGLALALLGARELRGVVRTKRPLVYSAPFG